MPKRQTLFLIDGSNNMYRSFYAIRGLTSSSGMATNAVYGFTQMLRKMLKEQKPDAVAVAFDQKGPTFRHKQYDDYKKDRKPMPDDLSVQVPLIYELCEGFRLPILTSEEYEADDLIGSLACRARDRGYRVVLATSDKDFLQLVGENIDFYHTGRDVLYDADGVREVFGLPPDKVVDVMAIWGDAIDNIPGVPGIGEKGAKALITEFGSLDAVYANLERVKRASQREALAKHKDDAMMSRELARIRCDIDVEVDFENLALREPDRPRLHDLFARLEFQSLMQEYLPHPVEVSRSYRVARSADEVRDYIKMSGPIAIHLEPDDLGNLFAASLSKAKNDAMIVPLAESLGGSEALRQAIRDIFSTNELIAHDMKSNMRLLLRLGWPLPKKFLDTMIVSYVLQPGAYGHALENLVRERLKRDVISRKEVARQAGLFSLDAPVCCDYIGEKADFVFTLFEVLVPELGREPALRKIYDTIEHPLIELLARMEHQGIKINVDLLRSMSQTMGEQLDALEGKIYAEAGQKFNINSPSQLGTILFEKLQYPVLKKTQKTKSSSTGVDVLKELASSGFKVPALILEHRELHKLKSTYVDALPPLVDERGRIHTSFNQAVAATGRLSSSDPNLQNIPIRTDQGREIRRAFIAEEGNVLLAADYSQIELRVLAHMSGDPGLIEAFRRGVDIHRATAATVFGVAEPLVNHEQRRASKTINFGVLYGMSAFRLAQDLGIPNSEAKAFIDSYFAKYPLIREFLDKTLVEARSTGKVSTLFGRVRYIPEIQNRSWTVRGNAERMATNAPIQGTAADLLKLAMIAVGDKLRAELPDAAMLLTVHDEIVLEVPQPRAADARELVVSTMEGVYPLAVPLAVDAHWGGSWYEAKQ